MIKQRVEKISERKSSRIKKLKNENFGVCSFMKIWNDKEKSDKNETSN